MAHNSDARCHGTRRLNRGPVFKCWSRYQSVSQVMIWIPKHQGIGIWIVNHSKIEQIPMIWITNQFAIQMATVLTFSNKKKIPYNTNTKKTSGDLKSGNIWNPNFLKVGILMVQFSNGRALAMAIVSTIWKPDHSKSGRFCPDFKWLLTKRWPFVWISNGWASGFQIPFKIQNISNPTCFGPFKIQTRLDFRSPLYCTFLMQWVTKFGTL